MPALTRFIDGSGPVVAGKIFPFCFITIACGAISGFHSLIASGTTPKLITRESYARSIGYGAMCLESLVAIMALIAACTLDPGVYLSMNIPGPAAATAARVTSLGFPVTVDQMATLASGVGEHTLFGRTGGAATLAVGMAHIFSKVVHGHGLDLWYHFAIMFEALFILTTLDAGTRVGRYILQDFLGGIARPLGDTKNHFASVVASGLIVCAWGSFLIQGVRDPLGGINSLWPLFGIANQMLAAIALCLATTIILKMQLGASPGAQSPGPHPKAGRPALALITLVPLLWLLAATMTAGVEKIFHPDPRIGFLAQASALDNAVPEPRTRRGAGQSGERCPSYGRCGKSPGRQPRPPFQSGIGRRGGGHISRVGERHCRDQHARMVAAAGAPPTGGDARDSPHLAAGLRRGRDESNPSGQPPRADVCARQGIVRSGGIGPGTPRSNLLEFNSVV